MVIWFFFSVIALLLAFFSQKEYFPKEYKWAQSGLSVWLAWFISFGSKGMQDQPAYIEAYNSFAGNSLLSLWDLIIMHLVSLSGSRDGMEIGFQFTSTLFNQLGFSYIGFAFFYAILVNSLVVKFIYRYQYPVISVLIFIATIYYSQQANLVRQMMACAMFLYATKFILSRQFQWYFLSIFLASLFHASSLLLLPVYFFTTSNRSLRVLSYLWVFSVALNYIGENSSIIQTIRLVNVSYYDVELDKEEGVGTDTGFSWLNNLLVLLVLLIKSKKATTPALVANLFVLGVIILNLRVASDWFYRVALYFTIFYVVLIPALLDDVKESKLNNIINKRLLNILFLIPVLYYLYILYSFVFRDVGLFLGHDMYTFNEMWK